MYMYMYIYKLAGCTPSVELTPSAVQSTTFPEPQREWTESSVINTSLADSKQQKRHAVLSRRALSSAALCSLTGHMFWGGRVASRCEASAGASFFPSFSPQKLWWTLVLESYMLLSIIFSRWRSFVWGFISCSSHNRRVLDVWRMRYVELL